MGIDDFKGVTLTPKTLAFAAALIGLAVFAYDAIQSYSRLQFEIERLSAQDANAASDISRLETKLDVQTNAITELKIGVNRIADQLERSRDDK